VLVTPVSAAAHGMTPLPLTIVWLRGIVAQHTARARTSALQSSQHPRVTTSAGGTAQWVLCHPRVSGSLPPSSRVPRSQPWP
jgi:hypothetical protein